MKKVKCKRYKATFRDNKKNTLYSTEIFELNIKRAKQYAKSLLAYDMQGAKSVIVTRLY